MKRIFKEENRTFNDEWELQYYLISAKNKMIYLLCDTTISTVKKCNAHQHYATHKNHKYANQEGDSQKIALQKLKAEKQKKKRLFQSVLHQGSNTTESSYKVAFILGKKGKTFSDEEIITDCIIEVVKCLDPDKVNKYKQIPLSRRTNTDRHHELAINLAEQFQ